MLPEGVIPAKVNYEDEASIVDALKGQQFLIITMHARADSSPHKTLVAAAAKAGVPYVMPNAYGVDPLNEEVMKDTRFDKAFCKFFGSLVSEQNRRLLTFIHDEDEFREQCEKLGVSTWITLACGIWFEFSLGGGKDRFGFDFKERSFTVFDEGTVKIDASTFAQCGRAVAALLSLKLLPEDENDKSPTISDWDNKPLYISSFRVSQYDMFESVKRVTQTTDADWTITYESSAERHRRGFEDLQKGDMNGFARALYSRLFYPSGPAVHQVSEGSQNDMLGLPKEDLDEYTKESVRRGLEGIL